jgi:predicted ATP-dependent serine protease
VSLPRLSAKSLADNWHLHEPEWLEGLYSNPRFDLAKMAGDMYLAKQPEGDIEHFVEVVSASMAQHQVLPGYRLARMLKASENKHDPVQVQSIRDRVPTGLHTWKSGIFALDEALGGGPYGLTVFAGQPKQGKSLAALGAGLSASQSGWFVAYVNAEMTEGQMHKRAEAWIGNNHFNPDSFLLLNTFGGCKIEHLRQEIQHGIDPGATHLMVVLDSLNRLHENDGSRNYWDSMEEWSSWARIVTRVGGGHISFLVVSELGVSGHVKGRKLDFSADCLIRFTEPEQPDAVQIDIQYSRSTPAGEVGLHYRDFEHSRFRNAIEEELEGYSRHAQR